MLLFHSCIVVIDGWLPAINDEHIKFAVTSGDRPPLDAVTQPSHMMSSLKQLIACCWDMSPDKRPSFSG